MRIDYQATDEVRAALDLIGRTEDLVFSPDGTRLAIAGFYKDLIVILDMNATTGTDGAPRIEFTRSLTLRSPHFRQPHGLFWADNDSLLVANRDGKVPLIAVPRHANSAEVLVHPIHVYGDHPSDFIKTPGSIALRRLGDDVVEALICNGYVNSVARLLLDGRDKLSLISSELVLQQDMKIPDGVAYSSSGKWVAISNHDDHTVLIYLADQLGRSEKPVGVLRGMAYPHGVRFMPDDRSIVIADAGAPVVHIFASPAADWTGTHTPVSAIQVVADDVFAEANKNIQEGGPKGIAVSPDGTSICITCEQEPLVFYDIRPELAKFGVEPKSRVAAAEPSANARAEMVGALRGLRGEYDSLVKQAAERHHHLELQHANVAQHAAALEARALAAEAQARALVASTSWKITWPMRAVQRSLRRLSGR